MSSANPVSTGRTLMPDWLPHHYLVALVLSMLVHVALLLMWATALRWFQSSGPVGFSNEPSREVGIYVERSGNEIDSRIDGEPNDGSPTEVSVTSPASDQLAPVQATSEKPPAETMLPSNEALPLVGSGANVPSGAVVVDPRDPIKSQGGTRPAATGARGGIPGAAFMGAQDQGGMRVVFVIDASGSMTSYNAMQVAKGALLSSLQALDDRQQFLVIFYDDRPHAIKLHDEPKPMLVSATELNKTLARQKIAGIQPGSGTDHLPPLKMAMQMNPDVIFFLTDALDPPLWPHDLDQVKKLNGGRIRIHSIEFGQGPELAVDQGNFLRKLASQNGGTYRYHDVTRFKAP